MSHRWLWLLVVVLAGCGAESMRRTRWYWDTVVPAGPAYTPHGDGRLYGVDLSPYRSIAFVVDVSSDLCGPVGPADNPTPYFENGGQSFAIDQIGQALADTFAALPPETRYWLIVATGGSHLALTPHPREGGGTAAGRQRAIALALELLCHGDHTGRLTFSLRRAFDLHPDVVVVLSSTLGGDNPVQQADAEKNLPEQRPVWADPVEELARWPHVVPVIAIPIGGGDPIMSRLAAATGGQYVPSLR
jgi:hypothetical protein